MSKKFFAIIWAILLCAVISKAQSKSEAVSYTLRVEPSAGDHFYWPYYLYVPSFLLNKSNRRMTHHMLVRPINTGESNDDINVHERFAKKNIEIDRYMADQLGVAVLYPVFPRPKSDWQLYTHALDRDTLLTKKEKLQRLDLQLVAMIDDARSRLSREAIRVDSQVLMWGFSAGAMFINRFSVLHPERVKAAVIGSPGGWPIAPVTTWGGKRLRYPVGVADLGEITGTQFQKDKFNSIQQLFILGDKDENDSVVFEDSYDPEDKKLVFELFGDKPVARWKVAEQIYKGVGCNCEFRLYKDVGHQVSDDMRKDMVEFFSQKLEYHP